MSKTVIFNQPTGCGDIIFIQSILQEYVELGYNVILPVEQVYANLGKHFPNISVVDKNLLQIDYNKRTEYECGGATVIPMRFSDSICKVPYTSCMKSKYMLVGKDWRNWKDKCKIIRDTESENKLFYDVLGLKDGEEYNLISENFTTGGRKSFKINDINGIRNVRMSFIEGFTHIDWLKVYQNATYIHAVSSSNIYLFELFELSAKSVHLYIRRPMESNHKNYDYILTKNYVLHN